MTPTDHGYSPGTTAPPAPLVEAPPARRRSPAEEARTLVARGGPATLATLSDDGAPWASMVVFGVVADGGVVLCVSTLAEHGRNLERDPRASIAIVDPDGAADPLALGRVTLAGRVARPTGDAHAAARAAYAAAVPAAPSYMDFSDFSFWVLDVDRVRWVGGYGRMDSATAEDYRAAEPDPVAASAAGAVAHLNDDHADALLDMAVGVAGYTDATAARCTGADRYGLDLDVDSPRGRAVTRVGFAEPCTAAGGLRAATVELTRRARAHAGAGARA